MPARVKSYFFPHSALTQPSQATLLVPYPPEFALQVLPILVPVSFGLFGAVAPKLAELMDTENRVVTKKIFNELTHIKSTSYNFTMDQNSEIEKGEEARYFCQTPDISARKPAFIAQKVSEICILSLDFLNRPLNTRRMNFDLTDEQLAVRVRARVPGGDEDGVVLRRVELALLRPHKRASGFDSTPSSTLLAIFEHLIDYCQSL